MLTNIVISAEVTLTCWIWGRSSVGNVPGEGLASLIFFTSLIAGDGSDIRFLLCGFLALDAVSFAWGLVLLNLVQVVRSCSLPGTLFLKCRYTTGLKHLAHNVMDTGHALQFLRGGGVIIMPFSLRRFVSTPYVASCSKSSELMV